MRLESHLTLILKEILTRIKKVREKVKIWVPKDAAKDDDQEGSSTWNHVALKKIKIDALKETKEYIRENGLINDDEENCESFDKLGES